MRKKQMAVWTAAAALAGALSVGGLQAYFTDREEASNVLTMGSVEIELKEPGYPGNDTEEVRNIYPGQTVVKDPQVTNTGLNPAYIRQELFVPVGDVKVFNPEGGYTQLTGAELVTYEILPGWTEQAELKKQVTVEGLSYMRHVYNYDTELEPGKTTEPLFSAIQVINLIEGEIPGGTLEQIPIRAHAVQSQGFSSAKEAWEAYGIQNEEQGWE